MHALSIVVLNRFGRYEGNWNGIGLLTQEKESGREEREYWYDMITSEITLFGTGSLKLRL